MPRDSDQKTIVIVEDQILVAMDLDGRLQRLGYEVLGQAHTREQALALVERTRPALVLMDIRLPGSLDGVAVAEIIIERHGTPVVYLTAHSDSETLERASATEPYGYLVKPIDDENLRLALETARFRKCPSCNHWQRGARLWSIRRRAQGVYARVV